LNGNGINIFVQQANPADRYAPADFFVRKTLRAAKRET